MLDAVIFYAAAIVLMAVAALAAVKGDRPEQIGAGIFVISWIASLAAQSGAAEGALPYRFLIIDLLVLAGVGFIAFKYDRPWAIWASALTAIGVAVHLSYVMDMNIGSRAYLTAMMISNYGAIVCLAIGTAQAWFQRVALGDDKRP